MSKSRSASTTELSNGQTVATVTEYDIGPYEDARGVMPAERTATATADTKEAALNEAHAALDKK